jgi:protein-S-isoprenylcysteine O-methyltransferase Ste14
MIQGTIARLRAYPAMTMLHSVIPALWIVFTIYWVISARFAKRNIDRVARWKYVTARFSLLALIVIALSSSMLRRGLRAAQAFQTSHALMTATGIILVVLGLALAVSARLRLGRNWGMPMSQQEDAELITGGPYAYVRHPIYSGIILGMIGSAIGHSVAWTLPLVLFGAYFIYSARREEELMLRQFPDTYPAYMRRTYMLVPYVL